MVETPLHFQKPVIKLNKKQLKWLVYTIILHFCHLNLCPLSGSDIFEAALDAQQEEEKLIIQDCLQIRFVSAMTTSQWPSFQIFYQMCCINSVSDCDCGNKTEVSTSNYYK